MGRALAHAPNPTGNFDSKAPGALQDPGAAGHRSEAGGSSSVLRQAPKEERVAPTRIVQMFLVGAVPPLAAFFFPCFCPMDDRDAQVTGATTGEGIASAC
ncbi:hypothetical protein T484DRAFT_1763103 [Baffinella frigidus]|nr:hypothetical protein T484DRAFT_1763103 [Cryptophyta sp. CCMP2293]